MGAKNGRSSPAMVTSAPAGSDVTIAGDEAYTRVGENLPTLLPCTHKSDFPPLIPPCKEITPP